MCSSDLTTSDLYNCFKTFTFKTFVQNQLSSPTKNHHLLIPLDDEEDEGFVWGKGLLGGWGNETICNAGEI